MPVCERGLFESTWARQLEKLEKTVQPVDERLLDRVLEIARAGDTAHLQGQNGLQTILLVSPPGTQSEFHQLLEERLQDSSDDEQLSSEIRTHLQQSHCPNLQTALKNIIRSSIAGHASNEEYADFLAQHKALIPMNFDLELLQRYVQRHSIERVLISIMDVEAFDTAILADLISTLHSWHDRIPLVLFVGISTTPELFESRFSRATISLIDATVVRTSSSRTGEDPLFNVYAKLQRDPETSIFLGPSVVNVLAELAEDQSTASKAIIRGIKYAYMTHFFANPVSVFSSAQSDPTIPWDPALCRAIRNLPTFKSHCETLAKGDKSQRQRARLLLTSNEALQAEAETAIQTGQAQLHASQKAISTLQYLYHHVLNLDKYTPWESEAQFLDSLPDLTNCDIYEAIEEALMTRPDTASIAQILDLSAQELHDFREYHSAILDEDADPEAGAEATFTALRQYLQERTSLPHGSVLHSGIGPFRQFMAESYTIAQKSPLSQIVHARSRYAIERALTRPADYLGCECCVSQNGSADDVSGKSCLPPTSLLLSMLNEAGVLVNVRDLWDAFRDTLSSQRIDQEADGDVDDEEDEEEEGNERRVLALFYRALAELRYLGLIKQSKRKPGVECIQKTAWMGL